MNMTTSEKIDALAPALAAAQGEFEPAVKAETSDFGHRYASLAEVIRSSRAALAKHGFAVLQPLSGDDQDMVITTRVQHATGQFFQDEFRFRIPGNGSGSGADPQVVGKLVAYYRRYCYCSMLGISMEDFDGVVGQRKPETKQATATATVAEFPKMAQSDKTAKTAKADKTDKTDKVAKTAQSAQSDNPAPVLPQTAALPAPTPEPEPTPAPEPAAEDTEVRRGDVCAVIADLIRKLVPGNDAGAKRGKSEMLERVFGSRMWTLVQRMPMDRLEAGLMTLRAKAGE